MRTLLLSLAVLVSASLVASVCAQPTDVANDTLGTAQGIVDDLTGAVDDTTDDALGGGEDRSAIADAAGSVGRFFQQVAHVVGDTAAAAALGVAAGTSLAADAAAAVVQGVAQGAYTAFAAVGSVTGLAARAIGSGLVDLVAGLAAGVASLVAAYAAWVSGLRPDAFPQPAFTAVAATGATASAAAASWGLWGLLKRFGWMLGGIAGFSRIEDDELLNHPVRARVFQTIQANPGIHASELTRRLDVGWGTIVHHLEKMEKAKLLAVRRINNQRCYFEAGGKVSRMDMQTAGAVRAGVAHEIAQFVASNPMTSQKSLSERLEVSAALTSFHVKKLVALGVITKVRRGKETLLSVSDSLRRVMGDAPVAAGPVAMQVPVLA